MRASLIKRRGFRSASARAAEFSAGNSKGLSQKREIESGEAEEIALDFFFNGPLPDCRNAILGIVFIRQNHEPGEMALHALALFIR